MLVRRCPLLRGSTVLENIRVNQKEKNKKGNAQKRLTLLNKENQLQPLRKIDKPKIHVAYTTKNNTFPPYMYTGILNGNLLLNSHYRFSTGYFTFLIGFLLTKVIPCILEFTDMGHCISLGFRH